MSHELYKKFRPKMFKDVLGQDGIISSLKAKLKSKKVPHAIMFIGPSGCGKTTIARILAKKLGCYKYDYKEINAAEERGIDMVRSVKRAMMQSPLKGGKCKVYCIDEAHKMSNDAMNAFLKPLEDTPDHVYFILCTTDPQKIIKTIKTRCTQYKLAGLPNSVIKDTVTSVCKKADIDPLPKQVMSNLVESANNSARSAVVLLDAIYELEDEDQMLMAIGTATSEAVAFTISKALMDTRTKWKPMAKLLLGNEAEEPETLRYMILGYARSALLKGWGSTGRAANIISAFEDNFYDGKKASLALACYNIIVGD